MSSPDRLNPAVLSRRREEESARDVSESPLEVAKVLRALDHFLAAVGVRGAEALPKSLQPTFRTLLVADLWRCGSRVRRALARDGKPSP